MESPASAANLRARVRYDGLWWRKFAYLGCVYGPEWWVGALVLVGYGVVGGLLGSWLLRRRDIS